MKGSTSPALIVLAVSACSAGAPASPPGPVVWPVGQYDLQASVPYTRASPVTETTEFEEYLAELTVAPDGSLTLTSSSGLCREPLRPPRRRDEDIRGQSFQCGDDVLYSLEPGSGTVRGEIRARVVETHRVPRACTRRGVRQTCWDIRYRTRTKTVRLRVF